MSSKVYSAAIIGLEASLIEVEVDISGGLSLWNIVGLPDKAVEESKERVNAALRNSSVVAPQSKSQRITVNLAPANLKKQGSLYDLPIAIGYLLESKQINFFTEDKMFCGELSLDGKLRHVNGILALADLAKKKGLKELFVPEIDVDEASLMGGISIIPVKDIKSLINHFNGTAPIGAVTNNNLFKELSSVEFIEDNLDFCHIKGQESAKRALELAAAGGHNVIFSGSPGSGKTILARSFATILPKMDTDEALEVTRIFSVAGLLSTDQPLLIDRPFRSPHHSSSSISLVGGGSYPKPGEVTLAHRGVLFLDEFPEFPRKALEALRQPLEDGHVTISRAAGTIKFPANFILVAAMNPCPCGHLNDSIKECICAPSQVARYKRRVSGPILDRIDIHVNVARVEYDKLTSDMFSENSKEIRKRVEVARKTQRNRFKSSKIKLNSEMNNLQIKKYCELDGASVQIMKNAVNQYHLSARSYFRTLKVARTIADLLKSPKIEQAHLAEAIQYRVQEDN
jgi:magnesium chelatase family protein